MEVNTSLKPETCKNSGSPKWRHRLSRLGADDHGVVMVYGAIVFFIVLMFWGMIFDTMRYIDKKMISQNAADAAAIEMAAWQSRGLNMVQEINYDIYQIDTFIWETINIMSLFNDSANLAWAAAIPNVPAMIAISKVKRVVDKICGPILVTFHALRGTVTMLKFLRSTLVWCSSAAGFVSAQHIAIENGASGMADILPQELMNKIPSLFRGLFLNMGAIGIPLSFSGNVLSLPVKSKNDRSKGSSLNSKDNHMFRFRVIRLKSLGRNTRKALKGKWTSWNDDFYETPSKNSGKQYSYPAWLWISSAQIDKPLISSVLTCGAFSWDKANYPRSYAIAMPRGGNVVRYTNQTSRKPGLGAGIEPALVGLNEVSNINGKLRSFLEKLFLMH